jgi:VWFA-related protein
MLAAAIGGVWQAQPPRYVERVEVARVLIDVRVVDGAGHPLRDLQPSNFAVKIDGATTRIDSAEWVDGGPGDRIAMEEEAASSEAPAQRLGRLIVLLFQKDFEPTRMVGLMRMLIEWQPFLENITPLDRIAVLSFDSRLKIWTDFTNDLERVTRVLRHGLLFEEPGAVTASDPPSLLGSELSVARARKTYTIEHALAMLGDALKPLPGAKSVVMIGHGFGRLGRSGVTMENGYDAARDALVAARASVFSLDVTQADAHSLEVGLQLVSEETGGFYASTFHFPERALDRIAGALSGHYVLFVEAARLKPGSHRIDVRLDGRKGEVLANDRLVIAAK